MRICPISAPLVLVCLMCASTAKSAVRAEATAGGITLGNDLLEVRYRSRGRSITAKRGKVTFIKNGRLAEDDEKGAKARIVDVKDTLGAGKGVRVSWPSGRVVTVALYPDRPLVFATASMGNPGEKERIVSKLVPLRAEIDPGSPVGEVVAFGPEGPYGAKSDRGNYLFLAVANAKKRNGVVSGWVTHHIASGIVMLKGKGEPLSIEALSEYGRLPVKPGAAAAGDTFAIGYFDDCLDGLEEFAATIGAAHQIKLPKKVISGYCTWYHARALDEKRMATLAEWCEKNIAPYGFDLLQIDDGWQISGRDFTAHNARGSYRSGMKPTAEKIRSHGFRAGIWLIPFGWDHKRAIFKDHQDYFVKRKDGSVYTVHWAGTCLDGTHPEARKFVREVVSRICREWKYNYIKIDGLWTGMATKILYPSPRYRPDDLGGAVLHDRTKTQIQAYRSGLKLVREAAGKDTFILGCNIAQNMRTLGASVGLLDGMRIGPDVGARWSGVTRCAQPTSYLYFLHNRVWLNDPDCLMLRKPLTVDQGRAWATLIAISGQMNLVSEWLPGLDAERINTLKRTNPNTGLLGRPVDLFATKLPTVWQLRVGEGDKRRDIVGVFNWNASKAATLGVDLADLGLPDGPGDRYVGFDFWENSFLAPVTKRLSLPCRPGSCRTVSLVKQLDRPQLLGTNRHVCQTVVDVTRLSWNASEKVLSGTSKIVGGDPYELRILAPRQPKAWQVTGAQIGSGLKATVQCEQKDAEVRVKINAATSCEVAWKVAFKKEGQ